MNADERGSILERNSAAFIRVHLRRFIFLGLLVGGCASNASKPTTRPSSVADRQDAALKDPFGYSPDMGGSDSSSGDIGKYDREGMRKDLDHVLNP